LTTKVLQNLANKVMFTKEPYMEEMNGFLKENMNAISGLFDKFAQVPTAEPTNTSAHVPDEQREEDIAALHYHLSLNLENMRRVLTSADSKQKGSHAFLSLTSVLAQLGPAAEPSKKNAGAFGAAPGASAAASKGKGNNNLHAEFMAEMAKLDVSALVAKKIFYKQGVTKDKQPVFYYIARRLDKQDKAFAQLDTLLYHILKTVQPDAAKKFVLVIDCTLFNKEHELPYAWITKFRQVAPAGLDNLTRIFFVNVNHTFKKYSKRIGKLVSRVKSKMEFLPSVSALTQHIPEKELGLPTSTLAVEKDVKATFSPVQKLMQYSNQKEVIIRISTNLVEVITAKQHSVFGKRVPLADLYHISSMFEINHAVDTNEVVIKYYEDGAQERGGGAVQSLAFKCPASDRIIMALKASKARLNLAKPAADASSRKRSFRASDVPGTLLNMALLNLGNTNAALRVEAYNLLASLCASFNLSVQMNLWETSGLSIPKNTNSFIVGLSKKLARTEGHMTLEFLIEALHGIEKIKANLPGKQLCLNYITHWLPNLRNFCLLTDKPESALNIDKTTQIIVMLMDFTIKETSMTGPAIQTKVWEVIGAVPELLDLVIEVLLARAFDRKQGGSGSTALSVIADVFVSMATRNARLVAGKLVARLLHLLPHFKGYREKYPEGDDVSEDVWNQLDVLVRILLMLSFDNLVYVQQYLPELFHIILLFFATGSPITR
jgi:neurofibromin 1